MHEPKVPQATQVRDSKGCPFHGETRLSPVAETSSGSPPEASPEPVPEADLRSGIETSSPSRAAAPGPLRGPRPMPLFGWRGNLVRFFRQPIAYMESARGTHGPIFRFVEGPHRPIIFRHEKGSEHQSVFALHAELNREVLSKPEVYGGGELRMPKACEWLNDNLASLNGEPFEACKAQLTPAFDRAHLQSYLGIFVDETDRMLDRWEEKQRGIDIVSELYAATTAIISRCMLGPDLSERHLHLAATMRELVGLLVSPVTAIPLNLPGMPYRRLQKLSEQLGSLFHAELSSKKEEPAGQRDFIAAVLQARSGEEGSLEDSAILGNMAALFFAGHDVPAMALIFALVLLDQHPGYRQELQEEIDASLGSAAPTYQDLWEMPVLDRTVKECLRTLGPALLVFRRTLVPTELGGYPLPAGVEVLLSPHMTHRDPELFAEPRRFRPERWDTSPAPSPFAFLPFSRGSRRCLGASFAMLELKCMLVRLLQRFHLEIEPGSRLELAYTFTINPRGPLRARVHDRHHGLATEPRPIGGELPKLVDLP